MSNDELFLKYRPELRLKIHNRINLKNDIALLDKFREFLADARPSPSLAREFISGYYQRSLSTQARYTATIKGFMRWYGEPIDDVKIKVPKHLPQYVKNEQIEKLLSSIRDKKSHKRTVERDLLIVELYLKTGMRLTIHRGTHEIGGSCVQLFSDSTDARLILDLGMPLVKSDRTQFEWRDHKEKSVQQLIDSGILPAIEGLYGSNQSPISAVLLSHAHQDHYGFMRFVQPIIPIYMSRGTKALAEVSNLFIEANINVDNIKTFRMWKPFRIGDFTITPYLMDHSAPDAAAFLIEANKKRIFYTGDFRGHGRKKILFERLRKNPPDGIDYLIMEGSMIEREEGLYPDETSVEEALVQQMRADKRICFVFTSSQNLDRIVSIYRAAKRTSRIAIIDLYTAFVLEKLRGISSDNRLLYVARISGKRQPA